MPYPNSLDFGGLTGVGSQYRQLPGQYRQPGPGSIGGQGGTATNTPPYIPPIPGSQPGGVPSPIRPQTQQGQWHPPSPTWNRPPAPTWNSRPPAPGTPPVSGTSYPPGTRPPGTPPPSSPPPTGGSAINNGFRGATWTPNGGVPPSDRPGGMPPAGPNPLQQDRYNQLAGIDPNLLWANQYNKEHGLASYGQDQANLVMSLLPPRLASQVASGMPLQTALGLYLRFLQNNGATSGNPLDALTGGGPNPNLQGYF